MPFEADALKLVILSVLALIVVGPKDLPMLLRKVGQFTAKMRGLANEFRASFDEMARQSELDELRREVEALRTGQFATAALPGVEEPLREIDAHLRGDPPPERQGTPPLPILTRLAAPTLAPSLAQAEPRFTDDLEPEPMLPFDGPAGVEDHREAGVPDTAPHPAPARA